MCGSWAREGGAGSGFLLSRYELVLLSFLTCDGWGWPLFASRCRGPGACGSSLGGRWPAPRWGAEQRSGPHRPARGLGCVSVPRGSSPPQACEGPRHCRASPDEWFLGRPHTRWPFPQRRHSADGLSLKSRGAWNRLRCILEELFLQSQGGVFQPFPMRRHQVVICERKRWTDTPASGPPPLRSDGPLSSRPWCVAPGGWGWQGCGCKLQCLSLGVPSLSGFPTAHAAVPSFLKTRAHPMSPLGRAGSLVVSVKSSWSPRKTSLWVLL